MKTTNLEFNLQITDVKVNHLVLNDCKIIESVD